MKHLGFSAVSIREPLGSWEKSEKPSESESSAKEEQFSDWTYSSSAFCVELAFTMLARFAMRSTLRLHSICPMNQNKARPRVVRITWFYQVK